MLVGREEELQRLSSLLEDARRGRSGALAIVGDPGVGKTALLEVVRERAADLRILAATGVESESELPFALLHELLGPVLELLPRIPAAQARALSAALALEEGESDLLAVAAGTLSLLVEAAEAVPILVLLDDAQWFDAASADALSFAVRRLKAEEIAVVAAFRPNAAPAFLTLPRLELAPLPADAARVVLRTRPAPVALADEAQLLAAAAGNPLALLELPVELARGLPASTTQSERLDRAFGRRLGGLPVETRKALLLAAAETDAQVVRRASGAQQLSAVLAPAEVAGLVRVRDGVVSFRHPVVRSLVYSAASADERAAAHRALAAVLAEAGDEDRRAWHLGAASEAADEDVAGLLELTADRAIARGGHAAASRALELAARLSPAPGDRARRLYAASRSERWGGGLVKARQLVEEALPLADDPLLHFDLLFQLRSMAEWSGEREPDGVLLQELNEAAGLEGDRRVRLLIVVISRRLDRFDAAGALALVPDLEQSARRASPEGRARGLSIAGSACLLAGERTRALDFGRETADHAAMPTMNAFDYMSLELYDRLRASLAVTLREAQRDRNLHREMWIRSCSAHLELRFGRLGAAEAAGAEAVRLGELLNDPKSGVGQAALAGVYAWRGDAEACKTTAGTAAAVARAAHDLFAEGLALAALGLLALGTGRPSDAISELEPITRIWIESSVRDPATTPFIPDLVEAYALTGATEKAEALLDRFNPLALAAGNVWMLAACARCEGLLAISDGFEEPFARALALLERSPYMLDLARTRLSLGERLRRAGRRRDARSPLQEAHDAFAAAGATPWQLRAAAELRAIGVRAPSPAPARPALTPQELNIAALVAEGKSNKEIATAMYLSPKTVGYHLSNTFRKLDIHSRAELARLMAESPG